MVEKEHRYSLRQRVLFVLLVGLAPYWFMNATVWIPWVFLSRTLGIVIMVVLAPVLWGYGALYCYKHTPVTYWKREKWLVSILFFLSSAISDVFFFYIWRNLSFSELYHPSTLASYGLVLVIPFIMEKIAKNLYTKGKLKVYSTHKWLRIFVFVLVFFLITLYCVRYW